MNRNPAFVGLSLLSATLFLLLFPMGAEARRPQDADQDLLLLSNTRAELKPKIEALEKRLHVEREKARRTPEANAAREAVQEAQKSFQALREKRGKADETKRAEARDRILEAEQAYQDVLDRKLAENPATAEQMQKLEEYRATLARLEFLLKRYAEQRR